MEKLEREGEEAANKGDYTKASEKYNEASKIASEIFKLGKTEMTKDVKRLTSKAREYEKLETE